MYYLICPLVVSSCVRVCCRFSRVQLFATLWTVCNLPGSSVHGNSPGKNTGVSCHALLQGGLPDPGIQASSLTSPVLLGGFFTTSTT